MDLLIVTDLCLQNNILTWNKSNINPFPYPLNPDQSTHLLSHAPSPIPNKIAEQNPMALPKDLIPNWFSSPPENLSTSNNYHTATSPKVKQTRHQRQKRTHKKLPSLSWNYITNRTHPLQSKSKRFPISPPSDISDCLPPSPSNRSSSAFTHPLSVYFDKRAECHKSGFWARGLY